MSKIELYNEDCMEGMKRYPDKHFDLAIVDPPYGVRYGMSEQKGFGERYDTRNGKHYKIKQERNIYTVKKWDNQKPDTQYFLELNRVSKVQIIWGENYLNNLLPKHSGGRIVWDKVHDGLPNFVEIAWTNAHVGVRKFRFMWNGMFQGKNMYEGEIMQGNKKMNERRIHPTQKPVALYKWLLNNYAISGDKILDTHLGSGSIAIACYDMEFDLIGFEIDKDYFDAALKWLHEHQVQGKLDFSTKPVPKQLLISLV